MRTRHLALIGLLVGLMTVRVTPAGPTPATPHLTSSAALETAYPGDAIEWDQPAATETEAQSLVHTIAWDGGARADITTRVCDPWVAATAIMRCEMPVPPTTTAGSHTITLTAYRVVSGTRYESPASEPFTFVYEVPAPPPPPTGCRIKRGSGGS